MFDILRNNAPELVTLKIIFEPVDHEGEVNGDTFIDRRTGKVYRMKTSRIK